MNQSNISNNEGRIDYEKLILLFLKKWYLYVITGIIAFGVAYYINNSTTPLYEVTSTILIQEQEEQRFNPDNFMSTLNMFSTNLMFKNEMLVLKSTSLIKKTFNDLNLNVRYFSEEFATKELYKDAPFIVAFNRSSPQLIGVHYFLTYLGDNTFRLKIEERQATLYSFSENKIHAIIDIPKIEEIIINQQNVSSDFYNFTVVFDDTENMLEKNDKFSFSFQSRDQFVSNTKQQLSVQAIDPESSAVILTMLVSNPQQGIDILSILGENYLQRDMIKKQYIANKTIAYIDRQLNIISDSLIKAEKNLQNYRVSHDVMDLQQQSGVVIAQLDDLKRELSILGSRINYYENIQEYFEENKEIADLIAPSSVGIEDPLLNNLMQELITLHTEKNTMLENKQEKNPYLKKINIRINNLKKTIAENIKYILNTLEVNRKDLANRIAVVNREIAQMPITERRLLSIERNFRLNDEIYTYLMERRSESRIAEASNLPRNEILEPAQLANPYPIAPKKKQNYIFAIFLAFAFTSAFIFIVDPTKNKVNSNLDVTSASNYPLLGRIIHNRTKQQLVTSQPSNSESAESFKGIYTNLQFFKYGKDQQTILVTSSFGSDGKSFISANLAMVYAKFGYKTALVEFDLRKPSLTSWFRANQEPGISNYFSGNASYTDLIQNTKYENLDYISAGSIPPNPTELTASGKSEELINQLKEDYQVVIIDTPPVGIVIDALHLFKYSDINLFIAREQHTFKKEFTSTLQELESRGIKNVTVVLNDHKPRKGLRYGYGYYKYNTSKEKSRFPGSGKRNSVSSKKS